MKKQDEATVRKEIHKLKIRKWASEEEYQAGKEPFETVEAVEVVEKVEAIQPNTSNTLQQ